MSTGMIRYKYDIIPRMESLKDVDTVLKFLYNPVIVPISLGT